MISLKNKCKAQVLSDLYNASKPLGMGFLHYDEADMSVSEAREILETGALYFDYLKGRVMKINLSGDEFDPRFYDRDNGKGAAAAALLRGL